jgi:hypothetical protein
MAWPCPGPTRSRTGLPCPPVTAGMVVQGVGSGLRHTHLGSRSEIRIFKFYDVGSFSFQLLPDNKAVDPKSIMPSVGTASAVPTHGSWLMAHGSWLMAHGSWLMAHGSWLMERTLAPLYPIHSSLSSAIDSQSLPGFDICAAQTQLSRPSTVLKFDSWPSSRRMSPFLYVAILPPTTCGPTCVE